MTRAAHRRTVHERYGEQFRPARRHPRGAFCLRVSLSCIPFRHTTPPIACLNGAARAPNLPLSLPRDARAAPLILSRYLASAVVAKSMPFQKGQSGNPHGRPKENNEVRQLARERSKEAIERLTFWMRSDDPKASVIASIAILDRAYGRPAQALSGPDGESPVKVIHEVVWSGSIERSTSSTIVHVSSSRPSTIASNAGPSSLPIAAPARPLQPSTTRSDEP